MGDGSAKSYPSGIDFADHNQPFLLYEILLFLIMLEQADAKRDAKVGHGDNYRPMLLVDVGEEGVSDPS